MADKTSSLLRILLVEDNEHDRTAFRRTFKKSRVSCEFTECVRGEEAVKRIHAAPSSFDLLVTDYKLPGMSGLDLCKELLAKEIPLPLVILTGKGSEQLAIEALKAGVYDYIIKDPDQGYLKLLPVVLPEVVRKYGERLARKRAEEALQKAHDKLEQRVQERTAELVAVNEKLKLEIEERKRAEDRKKKLEAQLLNARKMEAIGTMAGGIAHNFNNLLMGVVGNISLILSDTAPNHPYYAELKSIEQCAQRGTELTKQLLGFALGGKYEVKPTNLNEIVNNSSDMFGCTKPEIAINGKYETQLRAAEVDRGQIELVLVNLYVNAWQAMPGGGDIYLQTENVTLDKNDVKPYNAAPGNYVKVSIRDTGVGMDETTRQRIFEPFFTTKEIGSGTGLGLASVYGIIKNHGGVIQVYSEKGKGTTFNIYLPASEKEVVKEKKLPEKLLMGTETILLVDDESFILDVGEQLLKRMGHKVLTAESGEKAIEIYRQNKHRIDLVILDVIMPVMGGGEIYDRLKEINPAVKVLLSSGYSIDGKAAEILERGCSGFIQKPFRLKELSQKIRSILDS